MNIKELRKQAGLKQKELIELLGVPARTLQNWEAGDRSCPEYVERWIEAEVRAYMERVKPVEADVLRMMPTEPVWVVSEHIKGWRFVHGIKSMEATGSDVLLMIDRAGRVADFSLDGYGKTWSAYWRKSEA